VLLELTKPWHKKYAESHGMKYIDHTEKVDTGKFSLNSEGMVWFASCLNVFPEGSFISVLDADTLIVKTQENIRDGLAKGYELAVLGGITWVNGGVVLLINNAPVRDFFRRIIERGPVGTTNWLDATFSEMLRETSVRWHYLDDRWNFFPTYGEKGRRAHLYTEEEAIIRAWHGWDRTKALKQMSDVLEKISGVKA
jgi:hypothetical protein